MAFFTFVSLLALSCVSSLVNSLSLPPRAPCIVLSQGWEALDDSVSINAAIKECGNGGTIILPGDHNYSIRSTINFSPCRDCDVQLEGRLLIAQEGWDSKTEYISIKGVKGANFRSLSRKGVIDGNTRAYYQEPRQNTGSDHSKQPVLVSITGSSNIRIDGITAKNPRAQFYRVDGNSSNIRFSNLQLSVSGQWWQDIWTKTESIAFQFRNSSYITLDTINVEMRSNLDRYFVGVCIGIDYSTSDVDIRNINCNNTSDGVHIQFGSIGGYVYPPAADQWARNIFVSNLTTYSGSSTGFKNLLGFDYTNVQNVTFDGVKTTGYVPLVYDPCYVINKTVSNACSLSTYLKNYQASLTDIWFKNYYGKVGQPMLPCASSPVKTTCEFHFGGDWIEIP
ncbi:pectin lyase fold/virulence factor [Dendryphion nanum]|uniref:Pectin lyase fold/virulence factor n=1 Tax=Dendryphion nanum TaxID=256645 RepID=A0A9P9IG58_9PLEO|nr:pectin lyase fold/virulence factor [Dendryphion nanum]